MTTTRLYTHFRSIVCCFLCTRKLHHNTAYLTIPYDTTRCDKTQHNTAQHNTTQRNTTLHDTTLGETAKTHNSPRSTHAAQHRKLSRLRTPYNYCNANRRLLKHQNQCYADTNTTRTHTPSTCTYSNTRANANANAYANAHDAVHSAA